MKLTILRGSNEIGGTCIQLTSGATTILLDIGLPLSDNSPLIDMTDLKADAVLVSHPHQDHFGLMGRLPCEIPVYIGELGRNLIDTTSVMLNKELHGNHFQYFKAWKPFHIGSFTITPYLVDHSAVDAYAFLIEAEGKRVFYGGDFRAHGRKRKLFENMVKHPIPNIDLMFLEGTMMQRSNDQFPDEASVEQKILEVIRNQKNISFIISSSQNIDRIVSSFNACHRSGKTLVIDIYTAWVLEQVRQVTGNVPGMEWPEVSVYADYSLDKKLKANPEYFGDFRRRLYRHRVKWQELVSAPSSFLYFGRMSSFRKISAFRNDIEPVNIIYSQWLGYLDGNHADYFGSDRIAAFREDPKVNFIYAHTSGHAPVEDLQRLANALKPKQLIPIHTEKASDYGKYFENVVMLQDGDELQL
ncbi:MBL fold metallo-hydrolase [Trichlorobacter lovleyi]|uniref:MBL fold metallo-hydrolase n=1 Tax=Trichlorobacter lovleyi TaxID=313985 RepID=UPI00223F60D6|nr:MBL fold metallo-hydrolase [Trichlorobacter lovleyi]QOX77407.1 MBL fold metallo-hydrolase [Trichlorobacter lovleyi]